MLLTPLMLKAAKDETAETIQKAVELAFKYPYYNNDFYDRAANADFYNEEQKQKCEKEGLKVNFYPVDKNPTFQNIRFYQALEAVKEGKNNLNKKIKIWTYQHCFSIIHIKGWNKNRPFLVVTEERFFDDEKMGYSYYTLGVDFDTEEEAKNYADYLNTAFSMHSGINIRNKPHFTSFESQNLLLKIAEQFPKAEIKK